MSVLARLDDFRGESRFTTWAYKFALLEAAVKLRKRAWQGREVPLEPESWSLFTAADLGPEVEAEQSELLRGAGRGRGRAHAAPAEVLVALALNGVPIDVLAERLDTTRGALYKTLHDARRKLRKHLDEQGILRVLKRPELKQALGRLLGPAEAEIGCDACFDSSTATSSSSSPAATPTRSSRAPRASGRLPCLPRGARQPAGARRRRTGPLGKNAAPRRHQVVVTQTTFYGLPLQVPPDE